MLRESLQYPQALFWAIKQILGIENTKKRLTELIAKKYVKKLANVDRRTRLSSKYFEIICLLLYKNKETNSRIACML